MNRFVRLVTAAIINLTLGTGAAAVPSANVPKTLPTLKAPVAISGIDTENDGRFGLINIRLNGEYPAQVKPQLEDHGLFIQILLPDTLVTEPGKFFDGLAPHIPKVALLQLTPKDAGVRLFTSVPASVVKKSMTADIFGSRIVVTVDQTMITQPQTAPAIAENPAGSADGIVVAADASGVKAADEVIRSTRVDHSIPAPALSILKASQSAASPGAETDNFRAKMVQVTVFSGVLLMLLIAVWVLKPFLRRKAMRTSSGNSARIETLTTLSLAPRQKIALIQVGSEKFLIGITPEHINFLTAVDRPQEYAPRSPALPAQALQPQEANFKRYLQEPKTAEVNLVERPVLKKIPGNDPESLQESAERTGTRKPVTKKNLTPGERTVTTPKSRINIAIGDDGVKDLLKGDTTGRRDHSPAKPSSIEDVTRLIREKLNAAKIG